MTSHTLAQLNGTIDFGIITIKPEEYDAVLDRFPGENNLEGERSYRISDILTDDVGKIIRTAIVRTNDQGELEAQSAASDMIADLAPRCLLAVGIGGGIPQADFSLGDVVVATHIVDFSVEAVLKDGIKYNAKGYSIAKAIKNVIVSLKSYEKQLGTWTSDGLIPKAMPNVEYMDQDLYYGPDHWQKKVSRSLERRFGPDRAPRPLKVIDGTVASSNRLIKNAEITENLLSFVRSVRAVEMEVAGVYHAAEGTRKNYLMTTIRGISDIIGFERDEDWTQYACHSAAAFTYAFVRSGLLIAPQRIPEKGGLISVPTVQISEQDQLKIIRQGMDAVLAILKETKTLMGSYVNVKKCDEAVNKVQQMKKELSNISQVLNTGGRLPRALLPFHDAFLVAFGFKQEDYFSSLTEDIRHLRRILRTNAKDAKRIEIQTEINKITQTIKLLIDTYLS
jgi:nucleoside phosphorylase